MDLCKKTFEYFKGLLNFIPTAEMFVSYIELLTALQNLTPEDENDNVETSSENDALRNMTTFIHTASESSLKRCWSIDPKKPIKPSLLEELLATMFKFSTDPMRNVNDIIMLGVPELLTSGQDADGNHNTKAHLVSKTYPTMVILSEMKYEVNLGATGKKYFWNLL